MAEQSRAGAVESTVEPEEGLYTGDLEDEEWTGDCQIRWLPSDKQGRSLVRAKRAMASPALQI